eukprot:Amastigsp_a342658_19.p4 type:complete len:134 gc:universal Amastigsp_a342658_19:1240-839(-)
MRFSSAAAPRCAFDRSCASTYLARSSAGRSCLEFTTAVIASLSADVKSATFPNANSTHLSIRARSVSRASMSPSSFAVSLTSASPRRLMYSMNAVRSSPSARTRRSNEKQRPRSVWRPSSRSPSSPPPSSRRY